MRLDACRRQGQGLAGRQELSVRALITGLVQPSALGTNLVWSKSNRRDDRILRPQNYPGLRNRTNAGILHYNLLFAL